jgi:hypothetical protein
MLNVKQGRRTCWCRAPTAPAGRCYPPIAADPVQRRGFGIVARKWGRRRGLLGHGTTGNELGDPQTRVAPGASASHGNAVDTPAANAATQSLGNTDAGVPKKYAGCSEQGTDRAGPHTKRIP